jgi:DNA-binding transcriptional MerR regulator
VYSFSVKAKRLTTMGAARRLGISPDMVRYLARTGQLKAETLLSGQRIFTEDEIEKKKRERERLLRARARSDSEPDAAA